MKQMKKQEGQMKALKAPDFAPSKWLPFPGKSRKVACVPFMVPSPAMLSSCARAVIGCSQFALWSPGATAMVSRDCTDLWSMGSAMGCHQIASPVPSSAMGAVHSFCQSLSGRSRVRVLNGCCYGCGPGARLVQQSGRCCYQVGLCAPNTTVAAKKM